MRNNYISYVGNIQQAVKIHLTLHRIFENEMDIVTEKPFASL